jgi:hypothetical protein
VEWPSFERRRQSPAYLSVSRPNEKPFPRARAEPNHFHRQDAKNKMNAAEPPRTQRETWRKMARSSLYFRGAMIDFGGLGILAVQNSISVSARSECSRILLILFIPHIKDWVKSRLFPNLDASNRRQWNEFTWRSTWAPKAGA